jgi:zinc transporter ZupT
MNNAIIVVVVVMYVVLLLLFVFVVSACRIDVCLKFVVDINVMYSFTSLSLRRYSSLRNVQYHNFDFRPPLRNAFRKTISTSALGTTCI